ncbi:hypothetical protein RHSIM_Rhsim09G0094300 [Rhododendron simsii]|uniref:Retrotransposon gag domain-containing protein n=1 Tax=Rhododendron simsii TaxID=118357 RepID=A0A834LEU8_RHOSS|nr:hypothetical protein RHSIM_Rhsim09G0094300 [Rhododendron simsii]
MYEQQQASFAVYQLQGDADAWWQIMEPTEPNLSWTRFEALFKERFIPRAMRDALSAEFQLLKQGEKMTVASMLLNLQGYPHMLRIWWIVRRRRQEVIVEQGKYLFASFMIIRGRAIANTIKPIRKPCAGTESKQQSGASGTTNSKVRAFALVPGDARNVEAVVAEEMNRLEVEVVTPGMSAFCATITAQPRIHDEIQEKQGEDEKLVKIRDGMDSIDTYDSRGGHHMSYRRPRPRATPLNPTLYRLRNEIAAEEIVYDEISRVFQARPMHLEVMNRAEVLYRVETRMRIVELCQQYVLDPQIYDRILNRAEANGDLGQWPPQHPIAPPVILPPAPMVAPEVPNPAPAPEFAPMAAPGVPPIPGPPPSHEVNMEEEEDPEEWDTQSFGSQDSVNGPDNRKPLF